MPFTLSHPAAVLLLGRPPLVASALVAGAVAPDLPYLLPAATSADWGLYSDFNLTYTHQLGTGLGAGTVIAVLLLGLYHQLLKRPLLALLPPAAAGRLTGVADGFRWSPGVRVLWIVVSAVIGVVTHLIWDALVHENGSALWAPSPGVTEGLWWASTLAGALAIGAWLWTWARRTPARPVPPRTVLGPAARVWTVVALVAAGLAGVVLKLVWGGIGLSEAVHSVAALRVAVAGGMSGFAVGVLVYAVVRSVRPGVD